jgi:hypothetical protein
VNKQAIKKIFKIVGPIALICVGVLIVLKTAHAAESYLGTDWDKYLEGNLKTFTGAEGQTGEALAIQFVQNLIRIVRYIIGGVALVMGTIYAMMLVLARGKEETISKQRQNFIWVLIGFVILIISENVARVIFNPETATSEKLIDFGAARDQLRSITTYMKWLFGSIFVLLMAISSIRMVMSGGDEETITKQKRNLTWSFLGMLIMLLASNIVNAIYVIKEPGEIVAGSAEAVTTELSGIIKLLLAFLGPIAVIFTIFAGFYYMAAMDNEERAQKAKRMIVGGVTGIVLIYAAYAIVNTIAASKVALLPTIFMT